MVHVVTCCVREEQVVYRQLVSAMSDHRDRGHGEHGNGEGERVNWEHNSVYVEEEKHGNTFDRVDHHCGPNGERRDIGVVNTVDPFAYHVFWCSMRCHQ